MNPELKPASSATSSAASSVLDPSSPPTDTNLSKKPKLNIPESYISKLGWTSEDLLLSVEERARNCWKTYFAEREKNPPSRIIAPEVIPPEPLPKGWAWGSYIPGSGKKQFAYKIMCLNCGKGGDHLTDDCPNVNDPKAEKFREAAFTIRSMPPSDVSGGKLSPENK